MKLRNLLSVVWILFSLIAAAFIGYRFQQGNPIETDILALLPATERNPNAEAAVKAVAGQLGNRVVFLIRHADGETAKTAARTFGDMLRQSAAFTTVTDIVPKFDARRLTEIYLPHRASLLSPADRARIDEPGFDPAAVLLRQMHQPVHSGVPTSLSDDPFGFLQRWLTRLPLASNQLRVEDDLLVFRDTGSAYVLVLAEPAGSAFDATTQSRVQAAVGEAEAKLKSRDSGLELLRTGAIFYGEAARSTAESEVDLIGGGSLAGILLLLWLMFRSVRPLALGVVTVAVGVVAGTAAVLGVYDRLHIITLVFGASLIGEAVDYSIQYFSAHIDAASQWEPFAGIRRILPGLAIALATSLLGYAALSLTPFPAVRQIALFALAGLAAAWVSVVLILPCFLRKPSPKDMEAAVRIPRRVLHAWRAHVTKTRAILLCLFVVAVSMPGWLRLSVNDDIHQLIARPAQLVAQENAIRRVIGGDSSSRLFLVEGADDEQALQREEALTQRLREHVGKAISGYSAVSDFVPSQATQQTNRKALVRVLPAEKVRNLLDEHGFSEESGQSWQSALENPRSPLNLETWYHSGLSTSARHQILSRSGEGTSLIVTLRGDAGDISLAAIAADLPGVSFVDKPGSVSSLFAHYRTMAAIWLPVAFAIVTAILVARYGLRSGIAASVPTLLAVIAALGIYGYLHAPLTLFTMMGLVLVLGVGVNYSIFLMEAGDRAPAPFAGVILSAATTILSFGLLSLSSMPALHQFGLILLAGISVSVLLAPIAFSLGEKRP